MRSDQLSLDGHSDPRSTGSTANGNGRIAEVGRESDLLELFAEWLQRHHRDGGDFSVDAIAAAGDAGRNALLCGYPLQEAFEAARSAFFATLTEPTKAIAG